MTVAPTAKLSSAVSSTGSQTLLQPGTGKLLTVGSGMEFTTLADALKASVNGDTIAVKAGTYTNDFGTVTNDVHIIAVGGIVNEVATVPPPNDKGLLTVDNNLTIEGFTFTGGSDGGWDGNVAGIRLQAGNLNASYCDFHDMQEGLLADPDATASVTIDHCEFGHNGTGDGYTHNLYVGAVASLTVTNSYFHDAVVGHEIKSRAAVTTITNNVIADGPNGTASYDIDIPNAGVATISCNVIEKGPNASNRPVIHYGGETQFAWTKNSLSVHNNTIVNDFGPLANVVLNQSQINGLTVGAVITGNALYGFDPSAMLIGPGTLSGNTVPTTRPNVAAPVTWSSMPIIGIAAGNQVLNLVNSNHTVGGGSAHLTITDPCGSNTIMGGAGGLSATVAGGFDQLGTQAGATDQITLSGRNAVLRSAGTDHIIAGGTYDDVIVSGAATVSSTGFNSVDLEGVNEQLVESDDGTVIVGAHANAHLLDQGHDLGLTVAGGGHLTITSQPNGAQGATPSTATVSGALTGWIGHGGYVGMTAGNTGVTVQAGTGQVQVTGGAGSDFLVAGSGSDTFTLEGGADHVVFGSGTASVTGGTGKDTYEFRTGAHGRDTISGFKQGTDVLSFDGFTGNAVASGSVSSGNTTLTLTDGTTVLFTGVALSGYGAPPPPAPTPTPTPSPSPTIPGVVGTTVLTSPGQSVTGGASALTVTDDTGGNTIAGGTGGLTVTAGWSDLITTASGSTNRLLISRDDTVNGAGNDQVVVTNTYDSITEQGSASVTLQNGADTVRGGAGLLSVTATAGGASVIGGTGGLDAVLCGYDTVSTAAGATDTVDIAGYSTLLSQGTDQVSVQGLYDQVTTTGSASIASASMFSSFDLEGADSLSAAGGLVTVGQAASATVSATGQNDVTVTKQAGGSLAASAALPTGAASLSLTGGTATVFAGAGTYARLAATTDGGVNVVAGTGVASVVSQAVAGSAGDTVHGGSGNLTVTSGAQGIQLFAGSGNVTLNGGSGNDAFVGGAGTAYLNLGTGADSVTLGSGAITVEGSGAYSFIVPNGAAGTLVVQHWSAQDRLVTQSGASPAILSDSVSGGATWLTLSGGAQVELVGVSHFG